MKWSYLKITFRSGLVFLSVGWLVFYLNAVTTTSSTVSLLPLTLFAFVSAAAFIFLLLIAARHNRSVYKSQSAAWERSFICTRCGVVSQFELS